MKQLLITGILFAFISCCLFSCDSARSYDDDKFAADYKSGFNLDAVKDSIRASNERFVAALGRGDSVGASVNYTADAKIMPPNMPAVTGKEGFIKFAGESYRMGMKNMKIETADIWGDADLVAEEGVYRVLDDNGKEVDKGKFIALWKKEDGKWKIFRDMFNSDTPIFGSGH